MFKEIKKQITAFNVLILIAFLLIFIVVIVLIARFTILRNNMNRLKDVANSIVTGEFSPDAHDTKAYHKQIGYQYLVFNPDHTIDHDYENIIDQSLYTKGSELDQKKYLNNTFQTFTIYDVSYRVYTTTFREAGVKKKLQVYQQITTEQYLIRLGLILFIFIGSGGILLLIPISYFLAGKSLRPVRESYDNQKKFIADASHELRTPLTVIQTNVEVLRLKEDEVLKDNIHWLDNIASESETMSKLVSNLLEIARADAGTIKIEKTNFDLSALCAEVVDLMFDVAKDQQITLKSDIEQGIDYKGDADRLKQAIRILVDNAIKYTPGVGTVTLTLSSGVRNLSIAVKDTGVGLSDEQQKKIFSRFFRVDDARNRESGGFGLGLNIADVIVRQHGGHIKVDSVPNEGSTFTIILPK